MKQKLIKKEFLDTVESSEIFLESDYDKNLSKTIDALKTGYPDKFEQYNPVTDKVNLNDLKDDGWSEYKEAEILARKEALKCIEVLKDIRDTAHIKRDRQRAALAIVEFASGKKLKEEGVPSKQYNVNMLIAVLTGNRGQIS